jgi:hypothetical protein
MAELLGRHVVLIQLQGHDAVLAMATDPLPAQAIQPNQQGQVLSAEPFQASPPSSRMPAVSSRTLLS